MLFTSLKKEKDTIFRLARYALCYKYRLAVSIVSSILIAFLSIFSITMLKPVIEVLFNQTDPTGRLYRLLQPMYELIEYYGQDQPLTTLAVVCGMFLGIVALNGVVRFTHAYMVNWIGNRVILDLQAGLYDKMSGFQSSYYAKHKIGSLISYFTVDIRVIGLTVTNVFGRLLLDPFQLLLTVCALLYMQWQLTLIYTLVFPLIIWAIQYFARKNRRAGHEAQHLMATLGSVLQEHFSFIRMVQCYNMYRYQRKKFMREAKGVFHASMSMAKAMAASSPINEMIGLTGFCFVLLLGGYVVFYTDTLSRSDFLVFIALLMTIYQPTKRIERAIQQVQLGLASTERVFEVLNTQAELPLAQNPIPMQSFEREIHFAHVSFSYDGETRVLSDITFRVTKGQQIAFVGPSGGGKTTLANLIPRFYDPQQGHIYMDGKDIRELELESLRNLISLVPQEVMIFNDSAFMNIASGDASHSRDEVIKAAKAANAHDFIMNLPKGYDTPVGERGANLSGGQCQRLAIARAFLRDTPILIFDEATSSLDSESEQRIKESMQRLVEGRTSFIIAHRLSTILQADRIVVLDRGNLVSIGSHDELLQTCELYRRLYQIQFNEQGL
ncbi:ATP-binding cassette domain-containing protein [bacterium]|nr:ATP-binding cassette domain-containing protein [bacterium]